MPSGVTRPVTKKADPYEFDLPEPEELDTSRSSAMDTSAVLEPTEDIAETEDEAEASDEEEEMRKRRKDEEEDVDVDEDEREAQREAEAVADRWVGARVKKWFRLPKPRGRRKKGAPPPPDGEYVWGTVVETRARRMEVWAPHVPCAFVRYDDGDEEDMSLDECARWLADGRSTSSDGKNGARQEQEQEQARYQGHGAFQAQGSRRRHQRVHAQIGQVGVERQEGSGRLRIHRRVFWKVFQVDARVQRKEAGPPGASVRRRRRRRARRRSRVLQVQVRPVRMRDVQGTRRASLKPPSWSSSPQMMTPTTLARRRR